MKKILVLFLPLTLFLLSFSFVNAEPTIEWTEAERAYLDAHPTFTLGVDPLFIPYEYFNENTYQGITADYIALLEEKIGVDFQVVPNLTWTDAIFRVMNGTIDFAPAVLKTAEREENLLFSNMYYEVKRVIVTTNTNTAIKKISDLDGKFVAVQENSSHHSFIISEYPNINISSVATVADGLSEVSSGEQLAFIGNLATCGYFVKSLGLTNLRLTIVPTDEPIGLHFATSIGDGTEAEITQATLMIGIINKGLATITQDEKNIIHNRWITVKVGTDYGPLIQILLIIGSIILISTVVTVYWIFRLKKEIASRKVVQEKLEKAKLEAEEANNVKSSFMSRMSHEIRTPLNAITGMAYLLKKTNISMTQRMYTDRITQASTTMLSLNQRYFGLFEN